MVHVESILGLEAENVVQYKKSVGRCNKNSQELIIGNTQVGTCILKINVTGSRIKARLGQTLFHLEYLDLLLVIALCSNLCWRFGCRFGGRIWDNNVCRDASIVTVAFH